MIPGMKRYRVMAMDFDARANLLAIEANEEWSPEAKEALLNNKAAIRERLLVTYGTADFDSKLENFVALGAAPFSLVAFHNQFFNQARSAFVVGSYHPALTGICALGERVLNHLILALRNDYQHTDEYKRVYNKDSFDNWDVPIDALANWGVILPDATERFRKLRDVRNRTLHFNPETDRDVRSKALGALRLFQEIISAQFGSHWCPWYIPDAHGLSFVRHEYVNVPFVRRVVLPSCRLVGPAHDVRRLPDGTWEAIDEQVYPDEHISDEEFIRRFVEAHAPPLPPPAGSEHSDTIAIRTHDP